MIALVERFGNDILTEAGALDRAALAARAFADEESRLALNSIVHPLVGARTAELIDSAAADAVLVQDIPLLVEGGMGAAFHLVLIVLVDAEERVRRLVGSRGMPEADARARIAAQADDEQRRAAADVLLDNSGEPGALEPVVRALWSERIAPFASNIRTRTVVRPLPVLVAPDPRWAGEAARLIARLQLVCGDRAVRVDHIGSTAVEGMPATDVIDLQVTVADLATADELAEPLAEAGFPRIEHITSDDPKPSYLGGETDPALWDKRIHGEPIRAGRSTFIFGSMDGLDSSSHWCFGTGSEPIRMSGPSTPTSRWARPTRPPTTARTRTRSPPTSTRSLPGSTRPTPGPGNGPIALAGRPDITASRSAFRARPATARGRGRVWPGPRWRRRR